MTGVLGIDVGGTGIKAAIVDVETGELLSDRERVATPRPSTPANIGVAVRELVGRFDYEGTVGCCFPSVIIDDIALTAGNIDDSWRGTNVVDTLTNAASLPFLVCNDADAAGLAEMRLGAGLGLDGLVLVITVGTGIGSAMFYDGVLVPNIELGHMLGPDGQPIERYASKQARKRAGLDWEEWGKRFNLFLQRTVRVMSPDHIIIGGGASKKFTEYEQAIDIRTPVHIARFRNDAGIIGAALLAAA